ncbi:hypothetical protein [Halarchaeum nitratireducens]|uniref:Uncharacterized protein n=1 Tax=Halarchaeum nitratireducens TaxID=489913 RepID=A0A830GEL8_9EURY|nr:hypothetical protein [Halarchaeum nitratireducens]GGN24933.1 hypothetical protein GCM10009021_28520 [Halarchaeum nitratireducens]
MTLTAGERQRREVNTYNLFYSAVTARADPPLSSRGVRIPVMFPVFEDASEGRDLKAEPDIVLYDGSTCVLCEIKSGNNISERDIDQMAECAKVSIETAEEELKNAQVRDKTEYDGSVSSVESIIVYQDMDEDTIEELYSDSESFREAFDRLTTYAVLMTQDYGGNLRVLGGEFNDDGAMQSALRVGVSLPENPPDEIMLTEGMEPEVLAMAVTDIWGERALDHEDGVRVSRAEVRDFFAPRHNVRAGDLELAFEFLQDIGACEKVNTHRYEFRREHMSAILGVEELVMAQRVEEYLREDDQSTFDSFGDDGTN